MRIAINTRFLLPDYLEGYGYFALESLNISLMLILGTNSFLIPIGPMIS